MQPYTYDGKIVPHNDPCFRTPDAWDRMKQELGDDISEQCNRLERCAMACPRILLGAAIYHFLCQSEDTKAEFIVAYLKSFRSPHDEMTPEEQLELHQMETVINAAVGKRRRSS